MDALIHAVDKDKQASDGLQLAVRNAPLDVRIKPVGGLPFGEHKDRNYIEIEGSSWDGGTKSTLVAQLYAADLQRLFNFAVANRMVTLPTDPRIVDLVEQLRDVITVNR